MGRGRLVLMGFLLLAGGVLFTSLSGWSSTQPVGRSKLLPGHNKQFHPQTWDLNHLPGQADSLFDFDGDAADVVRLRTIIPTFPGRPNSTLMFLPSTRISEQHKEETLAQDWSLQQRSQAAVVDPGKRTNKHAAVHVHSLKKNQTSGKEIHKQIYTYEQILQEERAALQAEKEELETEKHRLEAERQKLQHEREIWQQEKLQLQEQRQHVAEMRTQLDAALRTSASQGEREQEEESRKQLEMKLFSERRELDAERRRLDEDKKRVEEHLNRLRNIHSAIETQDGNKLVSVDKANWEGLDSIQVNQRFPGIVFLPDYFMENFLEDHVSLDDASEAFAEDRFYELVTTNAVECKEVQRMGNSGDGGWDVCIAKPYFPRKDCIVYSFGINNDWSFDEALEDQFGCQVHSFDPSMNVGDHKHTSKIHFYQLGLGGRDAVSPDGWKLRTFSTIEKQLKHTNKIIDLVKIDIEHNEWRSFRSMTSDNSLRNVKQLVFEIHTREVYPISQTSSKQDFYNMWNSLGKLEKLGFRQFHYHFNPYGKYISLRTGKQRTCCYELFYININFLKENSLHGSSAG